MVHALLPHATLRGACLASELEKMKAGIHIVEFKKPSSDFIRPAVIPIMGINGTLLKAASFVWKSWFWQAHHADARGKLKPGIRLVILGTVESEMSVVAARKAFWHLGKVQLSQVAKGMNIALPAGAAIFDMVFEMCKHILKLSEEETLQIVRQRLQEPMCHETTCEALQEIEEAIQVLDTEDQKMVNEAKDTDLRRRESRLSFSEGYKKKSQSLFIRSGGKVKTYKLKHNMTQEQAKQLIPLGSSIWRNTVVPGWCGHVPGFSRCSASFHIHKGQQAALTHILKQMWTDHLDLRGLPKSFCTVEGLL